MWLRAIRTHFKHGTIIALIISPLVVTPFGQQNVAIARTTSATPYTIQIDLHQPILTLYRSNTVVKRYPVALGKPTTRTPVGTWRIINKQENWGAGFGSRWMGLNVPWGTYGIHGTNKPELIGKYVTNGCIRMKNANVEELYNLVPLGTPVIILGSPLANYRTLKHGDIGADVQMVQRQLNHLGFYSGACDGVFGFGTQFALIHFQLSKNLPMHGKVTYRDYRALGLLTT